MNNITEQSALKNILDDLHNKSYAISDGFISPHLAADLLEEFLKSESEDIFRPAGIGKDQTRIHADIRGDQIAWLEESDTSSPIQKYFDEMTKLKSALNQAHFLGLQSYECHFAKYPVGSFYREHLDVKVGVSTRKVSTVLYLNPNWSEPLGGGLVLYPRRPNTVEIHPTMGRLVVFLSEDIPHEVLESKEERRSLTGWYHRSKLSM